MQWIIDLWGNNTEESLLLHRLKICKSEEQLHKFKAPISKSSFRWQTHKTWLGGFHQVPRWWFVILQWPDYMTFFKASLLWFALSVLVPVTPKTLVSRSGTWKMPVLSLAWSLSVVLCLVLPGCLIPISLNLPNAAVTSNSSWKGLVVTDLCCWKVVFNRLLTIWEPLILPWSRLLTGY